jgi:cytochrome c oxidase cbb3-type subunit 3
MCSRFLSLVPAPPRARITLAVCILALLSCQRERRALRPQPAQTGVFQNVARESDLLPGGTPPGTPPNNPVECNAYAISEGQRLYSWYNCSGCHSHGGGGIGPPLIKQQWIYGGEPANLFDTIVRGRPNGMPSWGARIPAYQIWQIVTYIRSMNHEEPTAATPARSDSIESEPAIRNQHAGARP